MNVAPSVEFRSIDTVARGELGGAQVECRPPALRFRFFFYFQFDSVRVEGRLQKLRRASNRSRGRLVRHRVWNENLVFGSSPEPENQILGIGVFNF